MDAKEYEKNVFSHYNEALFKNMCAFADRVIEINLVQQKIKILHDNFNPELPGKVMQFTDFFDSLRSLIHPDDRTNFENNFSYKDLKKQTHGRTLMLRFLINGKYHTIKMEVTPYGINSENDVTYVTCKDIQKSIDFDADKNEKVDKALLTYKRHVTDTLRGAHMGLWNIVVEEGKAKYYADSTVAALIGVDVDTDPDEMYAAWYAHVDNAYKEMVNAFFDKMKKGEADEVVYPYNHPTWGTITIRCGGRLDNAYPGPGYRMYGYHQDVSEHNKSLLEQMEMSRSLSEFYLNVYSINLKENTYRQVKNQSRLERWFGVTGTLKTFEDAFPGCMKEEQFVEGITKFFDFSTLATRLRGKENLSYEYVAKHFGWCKATFIPVSYDANGQLMTVSLIINRIDAERRAEIAEKQLLKESLEATDRANAAKTEFLSHMSHDIRTPMNAIVGMTAIANSHINDKERVLDCLDKISVASNHLLGLINEVLDMSKIEAGKVDLLEEPFDISSIFNDLLVMTRVQIEKKQHTLNVDYSDVRYSAVVGDSQRLEQLLINFLTNAIKYTPNGGTINFTVTEKASGRPDWGCYEWVVEDNGIGMSEEFVKEIFIPFSRAEDSRTAKIQGSGLGMTIAKNLVSMMNGNIIVESELNKGSKFIITTFLKYQDAETVHNEVKTIASFEDFDFSGKHMLLVEDNEINAEIAAEIFSVTKIAIDFAVNGVEAFDKFVDRGDDFYDLVLMDVQMPIMNGYEATRAIRALPGDYPKKVPIFAMTANAFSEDVMMARNAGMSEHISKPLDFNKLIKVLNKWM